MILRELYLSGQIDREKFVEYESEKDGKCEEEKESHTNQSEILR